MLKQMREGAKSTVLKLTLFGLLLLAMAGLAIMDVQGMFRSGVGSDAVARVDGNKLSAAQFDQMVQNTLREQRLKQSAAYRSGIPMQILKQEIDGRLFAFAARDLGLQVGDDLAAKRIKELLAPLVAKGMDQKTALQRVLNTYGLSEPQLVAQMKAQIALQQLLGLITSGAHAPAQLVADTLRYKNEWRKGQYFTITADNLPPLPAPKESELKSYYDQVVHDYALPEYRTLSVLVLDTKALGEEGNLTEEKLKQYYEDNIADYTTPETRVISQAVAPDEKTAKAIQAEAAKTHDLQKAAGKNTYIKSTTMAEPEVPVEFSKEAFAAKAGTVLAPIQSPLGWHVVYVEKITKASAKPFALVKPAIERELKQDKVSEALYQKATKVDDEIAGGKTLAEVASENGLHLTTLANIDARGVIKGGKKTDSPLPMLDKLIETGFSLQKGSASSLIETRDGTFLIVSADEVTPSEQQSFEKVRGDVTARWKAGQQAKALSEKSAALLKRLNKGEAFEKVAGEFGKTVQSTALIKRGSDAAVQKMDEKVLDALFGIEKPGAVTAAGDNGSITLVRLSERKLKTLKDFSKEDLAAHEAAINRGFRQDLVDQYRLGLMDKYNVSINDKLMAEMYTPKDENGEQE